MRRVCFLFNHDQINQVAHSLPIALQMMEMDGVEVTLAFADKLLEDYVQTILGDKFWRFQTKRLTVQSTGSKTFVAAFERLIPARKIAVYRDNLDFFRTFDALVVSEKTSLLLKSRYGLADLKFIHTRHGAGDRAIGFNRESAQFDLVLVSGPKISRRLVNEAGVDPAKIRMVGYPKFDLHAERRIPSPFQDQSRPTILYAPHPSPKLSSYYRMGMDVVKSIARSGRFNLILAPHVMLMQRNWVVTVSPPAIAKVPRPDKSDLMRDNVVYDPGSPASADMSYTNFADLYIGDVSSQIYEFLLRPRPCLHLNAHEIDWRGNPDFAHWTTGPVIEPHDNIVGAIDNAIASFPDFKCVQEDLFADTIDVRAVPAGLRAARAVVGFLNGN